MTTVTSSTEKYQEKGLYVVIGLGIPGVHTQAETLDDLHEKLKEVMDLCLEEIEPEIKQLLPQFVRIKQLEVSG